MIKRSAMKLGRGLRHVKTNKDGVHGEEDPDKKITVGICVLEKKALSSPMTEVCQSILCRYGSGASLKCAYLQILKWLQAESYSSFQASCHL
jgi:hypothetical protein